MRYKVTATFQEEQRRGFMVTHQMDREFGTATQMSEATIKFLSSYNSEYCHHLDFHVVENKK